MSRQTKGEPLQVKYWPPHPVELMSALKKPSPYRPTSLEGRTALAAYYPGGGDRPIWTTGEIEAMRRALISAHNARKP